MVSQMLQNSTTCTFIPNNLHLCSTRYTYIQHFIFTYIQQCAPSSNLNQNHLHSTKIPVQLQPNTISFNKHACSTPTKNNLIQQQHPFNPNPNHLHSTKTTTQLQPETIPFNNEAPGHPKHRHSTKFPFPPTELPHSLPASKGRLWTGTGSFFYRQKSKWRQEHWTKIHSCTALRML